MKTASPALASLIYSGSFQAWHIYQIALTNGATLYYTNADFDIWDTVGNKYSCGSIGSGSPKIDADGTRATAHMKAGLDADQWTVTLMPTVQDPFTGALTFPDVVGSTPWLAAVIAGLFDGATVLIQAAYFATAPTLPLSKAKCTAVGTTIEFSGPLGQIDANQNVTVFNFNSWNIIFASMMPRNLYQSSCPFQVFDSRCSLVAATYAKAGTVLVGSTQQIIKATPAAPTGSGTYQLGKVTMTSGLNAGFSRLVSAWDGLNFQFLYPLPFNVITGDTFTVTPGCDKSTGTGGCNGFGNILNFGGTPYIPLPETQLG